MRLVASVSFAGVCTSEQLRGSASVQWGVSWLARSELVLGFLTEENG